ncbi:Methyltransferase domain-containing protein [Actinopolyspora lacussalsi subsp. righensis]|uniref:Methyltransferase domain-containing protein n=1 Tax=Actinopolyspora righensis TaxID=995060 RepID=A0A1I6X250_9ACTN|nr:class I SAM-dependent methyltransferase [Actinopolyspora righensis]SFT32252.1 Methyltransferase domain-containing protein [Actinopolyspora righensis]
MTRPEVVQKSHQLGGDPALLSAYYGNWATTYEKDAGNLGYVGPRVVADLFGELATRYFPGQKEITGLDAGCGTGLAGPPLLERGVSALDGLDLSQGMVAQAAETGAYRILSSGVDLNLGLSQFAEDVYDVTISCGVFIRGHLNPTAVDGLVRVTRPGGIILITTGQNYLDETDFAGYIADLSSKNQVNLIEIRPNQNYLMDEPAHYWVLQVPPG